MHTAVLQTMYNTHKAMMSAVLLKRCTLLQKALCIQAFSSRARSCNGTQHRTNATVRTKGIFVCNGPIHVLRAPPWVALAHLSNERTKYSTGKYSTTQEDVQVALNSVTQSLMYKL
jgi:hypothetical protein